MECRGGIAQLSPTGDYLTVWSSTQIPHLIRTYISEELSWPASRLRVIAPEVGGGFGVKGHVFAEEVLIARLAILTKRTVKWIEDRREHLIASIHAREHEHTLEAYVAADGRVKNRGKAHAWKANYHDVRAIVKFVEAFGGGFGP